jgi:uncharacterized protein
MSQSIYIPMFPLNILPLPGELVPLHIFEPRYKELLQDAEVRDIAFGIYFTNEINHDRIGSLMTLESIIKRYPNGELDIVVKCTDIFYMDDLYRNFKDRTYPGGNVRIWNIEVSLMPGESLYSLFNQYLSLRNITTRYNTFNLFEIANELNLDLNDRYRFLMLPHNKKENFLWSRITYQVQLLKQEENSKDVFHLN